MKPGTRVKYIRIDTNEDIITSGYYPPIGTFGTVTGIDKDGVIRVKWDNGTKGNKEWWANYEDLEEVGDINNELVDKIASFLEEEENWMELMNCRIENGKSYDLRMLLYRAIKM